MSSGAGWEAARAAAHEAGRSLRTLLPQPSHVPLADAVGRVLASDLRALYPLPHYPSSAMDGWAVSGPGPWRPAALPAPDTGAASGAGSQPAAGAARPGLAPGRFAPILTGGLPPEGTTAVLRREHGTIDAAGVLHPTADPAPGTDIRPAGTEAAPGDLLLPTGTLLSPGGVAAAAVAGHDLLPLAPVPAVRLVFTGDEVDTSGIPLPGRVRDSFGPVLPACVAGLGGTVAGTARIGDDRAATLEALDGPAARAAHLLVTTGGTGGSAADHLRPAARELGAETLVDSVAMRPGHPALLARLPDGRLLLGLPGNPLAALMAVATLLEPVLRGAAGRPASSPATAVSGADLEPLRGRHRLVPARRTEDTGTARLVPVEHTGPAMMRGLASADVVLVVPPAGLRTGGPAPWLPLPW